MNPIAWMLLLAHLLGDYPLQPDWLVRIKQTWLGLIFHVGIHLVVLLVLAGSGRTVLWPYLLALAAIHFVIDIGKNWVNRVAPTWISEAYLIDQLFHVVSILAVAAWIKAAVAPDLVPSYGAGMLVAAAFVAATYAWYISERIFVRMQAGYLAEVNVQKWTRMLARGLWLLVVLALGGFLAGPGTLLAAVVPVPYLSGRFRGRALLTDLAVALATGVFLLMARSQGGI